ncbi:hypothetical protein F511_25569 [Dorcoceras hygrometricum]|uniref:Uncharacterized protein n=1 Tax=Dorcoceras hygrometricum TaxID=472368 RepID=A0A2Z7B1Z2_9LAMI|nr:hypothetical protein F511_25569 [Dorcoceras hygrometricum]
MASALINNTVQVYFASVLGMDHEGMVSMFEALVESDLSGFLGCSSALFEAALVEFLHNASVRDGIVCLSASPGYRFDFTKFQYYGFSFFTTDETPMGVDQILMPTAVTPQDFTEPLAQLRALVNQISTERVQTRADSEKLKDMLLLEIRSLEKKVTEMLLGELVAYINRGGNDKKGEGGSSSRRTQPPPDDHGGRPGSGIGVSRSGSSGIILYRSGGYHRGSGRAGYWLGEK